MYVIASGCIFLAIEVFGQNTPHVANQNLKSIEKKQRLTAEQRAQRSVDGLDKIVGLMNEQKTKIYELALNRSKLVDAVIEKYKGQADKKEQAKSEIHQIRVKYRQKVKSLLSPEQIEKLKKHHKANHSKPSSKRMLCLHMSRKFFPLFCMKRVDLMDLTLETNHSFVI